MDTKTGLIIVGFILVIISTLIGAYGYFKSKTTLNLASLIISFTSLTLMLPTILDKIYEDKSMISIDIKNKDSLKLFDVNPPPDVNNQTYNIEI